MKRTALLVMIPGIALVVGMAVYLFVGHSIADRLGFPLDDSWIHLTIARNVASGDGFGINPGHPVGASTAPLWTLLLVPVVGIAGPSVPLIIGISALVLLVGLECTRRLYLVIRPEHPGEAALAAILTALLPTTLWGVMSGLEVSLALTLTAASLLAHARFRNAPGWPALLPPFLMGLTTLARPEALLLFPLALLDGGTLLRPRRLLVCVVAFVLPLAPVILFHLSAHGAPFPTTFYAKIHNSRHPAGGQGLGWALVHDPWRSGLQLFYHWSFVHLALYWKSLLDLNPFLPLLVSLGAGTCLHRFRNDTSLGWLPLLSLVLVPWTIGILTPRPDYGAGDRYISFLNPVVAVLATAGIVTAVRTLPRWGAWLLAVLIAVPAVTAIGHGAQYYGWCVKNTEEMHVRLAKWVRQELPPGAIIAVHDLGAMAFFGGHPLIDLEGIGSPDMLPHKRNADALFIALYNKRPDYLIVAPNWYPNLLAHHDIFQGLHPQEIPPQENHVLAGPRMEVYQARWPSASP